MNDQAPALHEHLALQLSRDLADCTDVVSRPFTPEPDLEQRPPLDDDEVTVSDTYSEASDIS